MKPVQGEPWPVKRYGHAACCLNYGQDHPQLLVYGGEGNKPLGDMWILDVDTCKWAEVSLVLLCLGALAQSRYTVVILFVCLSVVYLCRLLYSCSRINEVQVRVSI